MKEPEVKIVFMAKVVVDGVVIMEQEVAAIATPKLVWGEAVPESQP